MPHTYFIGGKEMEIERKFLISDLSKIPNLDSYKKKDIVQNYLYKDIYTSIRKRLITENRKNKIYLHNKNK